MRATEEKAHEAAERLRGAVEKAPVGMALKDAAGRCLWTNPALQEMLGYGDEELRGMFRTEFTHPGDAGEDARLYEELLRGEREAFRTEKRYVGKDGGVVWGRLSVFRVGDEPDLALVVVEDVDERKRTEEALRTAEARFRAITEGAAVGIALTDLSVGRLVEANPALRRMLGYSEEELLGMTFADLTHPDDVTPNVTLFEGLARGERDSYQMEKRYLKKDGGVLWGRLTVSLVREDGGEPRYVVGMVEDVTERKALEERLRHQAFHDALTGLPNRYLFADRLGQALARSERRGEGAAVLLLNLDNFRRVNDSLGREAGDRLLVAVAGKLLQSVRPEDTVARLGGDEFAVLVQDAGEAEATRAARRVADELEAPFGVGGRVISVTASIGISLGGAGDAAGRVPGAEALLRQADAAMHEAKGRGGARHEVYEESMGREAGERLELGGELRRAVKNEEFEVHYQPEVELGTGRVVGAEALVRWRHPERGLLAPARFIPLAEETGLIVPIGRQVLRAACEQAREWRDRRRGPEGNGAPDGEGPRTVWVNLSALQLREPDLVEGVSSALAEAGLEPRDLGLEVTESALVEDGVAGIAKLEELKALGVSLAIDDFGTGYSSLSYLKRLPVDHLKVDRSFVAGLGKDAGDATIVSAVVGLARAMGLGVVAEGVETGQQLGRLEEMGCDVVQGYLLAGPMPGGAVPSWLPTGGAAARA